MPEEDKKLSWRLDGDDDAIADGTNVPWEIGSTDVHACHGGKILSCYATELVVPCGETEQSMPCDPRRMQETTNSRKIY